MPSHHDAETWEDVLGRYDWEALDRDLRATFSPDVAQQAMTELVEFLAKGGTLVEEPLAWCRTVAARRRVDDVRREELWRGIEETVLVSDTKAVAEPAQEDRVAGREVAERLAANGVTLDDLVHANDDATVHAEPCRHCGGTGSVKLTSKRSRLARRRARLKELAA